MKKSKYYEAERSKGKKMNVVRERGNCDKSITELEMKLNLRNREVEENGR